MLGEVFGVEADVIPDPRTGTSLCIPYGLRKDGLIGSRVRGVQRA